MFLYRGNCRTKTTHNELGRHLQLAELKGQEELSQLKHTGFFSLVCWNFWFFPLWA